MTLFTFCNPKELRIETRVVLEGSLQDVFPGKETFQDASGRVHRLSSRRRMIPLFEKANNKRRARSDVGALGVPAPSGETCDTEGSWSSAQTGGKSALANRLGDDASVLETPSGAFPSPTCLKNTVSELS